MSQSKKVPSTKIQYNIKIITNRMKIVSVLTFKVQSKKTSYCLQKNTLWSSVGAIDFKSMWKQNIPYSYLKFLQ